MSELADDIAAEAAEIVEICKMRDGRRPDFTPNSLDIIEDLLAEVSVALAEIDDRQRVGLIGMVASYILEVARREFGGVYQWHQGRNQPVLVVTGDGFRVAMLAGDRVAGRLAGDEGDNIPFFYEGFAGRVRRAMAGDDTMYV